MSPVLFLKDITMECYTLLNLASSLTQLAEDYKFEVKWIERTNFKLQKESAYFCFYITPTQKPTIYSVKITIKWLAVEDKSSRSSLLWRKDEVIIDHEDSYEGFVMCMAEAFLNLCKDVKNIEEWYPTYRDIDPK